MRHFINHPAMAGADLAPVEDLLARQPGGSAGRARVRGPRGPLDAEQVLRRP